MKQVFFVFLAAFVPFFLYGQNSYELWFRPIHSLPNFSPSYNYWVHHDSEGFVWISSTAGLNRFDGRRVKSYTAITGDNTSLADDNIQSNFYEDKRKNLWFSTASAIHCYRRETDDFCQIPFTVLPSQPEEVHVFFLEKDTFLWYLTGKGVYRLDIHTPSPEVELVVKTAARWAAVDTAKTGSVTYLFGKGNLLKSDFGYWPINNGASSAPLPWFDESDRSKIPTSVNDIFTENGISWVGTNRGLVRWDRNKKSWTLPGENKYPNCWIEPWGNDRFVGWSWDKGLFIFDKDQGDFLPIVTHTLEETDLNYQKIFDLHVDRDENLWVSFYTSGLMYANLRKTKFRSLSKVTNFKEEAANYPYLNFLEDEDGTIWHGTNTTGLIHLDGNGRMLQHFMPEPGNVYSLPNQWVEDLAKGKNGRVWVGTRGGLAYFQPGPAPRFYRIRDESSPQNLDVFQVLPLADGILLVTTQNKGVFKIDETGAVPRLQKVFDTGSPYTSMIKAAGRIFISRNDEEVRVFKLAGDTLLQTDTLPLRGLISGFVNDEKRKVLWIGSWSGLVKVDLDAMMVQRVYTEKDGLPNKNIQGILADDAENIWLSTAQGLVRFFPEQDSFRVFSLADGTQSFEFQLQAALRRKTGELWFGGSRGVTIVPSSGNCPDVEIAPRVKLTSIEINFEPQPLRVLRQGFLDLPFQKNTLSFEFVALEYSDPLNNQLWYKLENADDDWIRLGRGEPGVARYPSLRFGEYIFKVKAFNADGVASETYTLMTFTIQPPWYFSWWAIILYVIAVAGAFYLYYRYRVAQIKRVEEMRRKEAEFKQKEAELKQQMAEFETAVLRLQMNPHFIFNSMNSINSYILQRDIDTASNYLGRFAKLMRMILKYAAQKYISVSDEIELLELYLQTEAMRFEQRFTYHFEVDETLDPDEIVLPTMILQPFVENAILHGLSPKATGGRVVISFEKQNGSLACSVEDNGGGRLTAAAQKDKSGKHESKALAITTQRLKLLEQEENSPAYIEMIDLKNDEGQAAGTKVLLILPFL